MSSSAINSSSFQGIVIGALDETHLTPIVQGRAIWDGSNEPPKITYSGELVIKGFVQVLVPADKQNEIRYKLDDNINFFVSDNKSGETFKSSRVVGGWNLARQGISLTGFSSSSPAQDINEDFTGVPDNIIDKINFEIELFDLLADMPSPGKTLEIYAEYKGFTSNKIFVNLLFYKG
ncbi:MAG: hypothetical protein V4660_04850 [Pseudomonadota bacterium]